MKKKQQKMSRLTGARNTFLGLKQSFQAEVNIKKTFCADEMWTRDILPLVLNYGREEFSVLQVSKNTQLYLR